MSALGTCAVLPLRPVQSTKNTCLDILLIDLIQARNSAKNKSSGNILQKTWNNDFKEKHVLKNRLKKTGPSHAKRLVLWLSQPQRAQSARPGAPSDQAGSGSGNETKRAFFGNLETFEMSLEVKKESIEIFPFPFRFPFRLHSGPKNCLWLGRRLFLRWIQEEPHLRTSKGKRKRKKNRIS